MHNCFMLILSWIGCIQLFLNGNVLTKMNQVSYMMDTAIIVDCINLDSLLESGELGYSAVELDKDQVKKHVKTTLENNFPNFKFDLYYYFYDARTLKNCSIEHVSCNSVQIKIIVSYQNFKEEAIVRYELKER